MSEDISFIDIWKGGNVKIKAVQINKSCPYSDFFDELIDKEQKKVEVLFYFFDSQNGRITNNQKLKKLNFTCEGCFEFKPTGQIRISFVYLKKEVRNCICLLDGFKKKQNKWPKNERQKTQSLCKKVRIYEEDMRGK